MKRNFAFGLLTYVCLLIPGSAAAYDVLETNLYQVTPDAYLFMIEFEYGYLNAEAWLPILTNQPITVSGTPSLQYEVTGDGMTAGIVLSDAEQDGRNYYIPSGERETFTLVVVQTGLTGVVTPELRVTDFTHVVNKGDGPTALSPTAAQLAEYRVSAN